MAQKMIEGQVNGARRRRRGTGNIRLTDIAKIARVSPITVSRVINTPDSVSADTLRRVRDAIDRTGYVPNLLAGGLASMKSRLVAAVVPSVTSPVFQETIAALIDSLEAAGYQLMLGQSGYSDSHEDELLDAILGRRPDGIVLVGVAHSASARRRLAATGIPIVETWDLTRKPIDMLVGFSHEKIGAAVADHLRETGRVRPAIITAGDERARRRAKGMRDRLAQVTDHKRRPYHTPTVVVDPPGTVGKGRIAFSELMREHRRVDAVFCSSDMLALGVMFEAQARGIRLPEQLAVVGYGDLDFARDVVPSLTSVRVNATDIGRRAAKCIIDRAQGRVVQEPAKDVGFSIAKRETS